MLGGRDMKFNGSTYKNTDFHSPLHRAFHGVAQGWFHPEQLHPTLPFLILMSALITPSPSLGLQALTFMPKTLPRKEKPIVLIISTEKNMRKWENLNFFFHWSPQSTFCECHQHLLSVSISRAFRAWELCSDPIHKHTLLEITFFFTTAYFL